MRQLRRHAVTALLVVAAAVGCDSPFAPPGAGERVPVGVIVNGSLSATDSVRRYAFLAERNKQYAVFVDVLEGSVLLQVYDSATRAPRAGTFAQAGSGGLYETATGDFVGTEGVLLIEVQRRGFLVGSGSTARFQFLVYQVDTAPERHPAAFAIGDTVSEELETIADVDEFVASGDSGQELFGVLETLGPGGGGLTLTVSDPATGSALASGYAVAGQAEGATGRFALLRTTSYRFTVQSSGFLPPASKRYAGAYRFRFVGINRTPEKIDASIAANVAVAGEAIDGAGDVDEFSFSAVSGQEFNAFLQSSASTPLTLTPLGMIERSAPGVATTVPADTGLFEHATGWFRTPVSGNYRLRVEGSDPRSATGPYRLYLYRIDRAPEHAAATLVAGDTVSEAIDPPGDVDEFRFAAQAGQEYNVFLQAQSRSPQDRLYLDVPAIVTGYPAATQSVGTDTALAQHATGRFTVPDSAVYTIRVQGEDAATHGDRGPYRVFLYRIDRRPERAATALVLGDSVVTESVDLPGDVDEFHLAVRDTTLAAIVLTRTTAESADCLEASLIDSTGHAVLGDQAPLYCNAGLETSVGSGPVLVPRGTYTLRVFGAETRGDGYRGPYRIRTFPLDSLPESVPDTLVIGDTVSGEALALPGDYDLFRFAGRKAQHIDVLAQGLAAPLDPNAFGFGLALFGPTSRGPIAHTGTPTAAPDLVSHRTGRVDLSETGVYRLSVSEGNGGQAPQEVGPYRFAVVPVSSEPEAVSASLVPGDSVTTEALDFLGDWDEYVLSATPGQRLHVVAQALSGAGYPRLVVSDSTGLNPIASAPIGLAESSTAPFTVPSSGRLRIAVFEPRAECCLVTPFVFVGRYRLAVVPFDPGPEIVAANFALGDTVRGEAIHPTGDVDEFSSTGTPGATLTAGFRLVQNADPSGDPITLEVVDPATGAVLTYAYTPYVQPGGAFVTGIPVAVPPSGRYVIRVRGLYDVGTAPYEFFVTRRP